MDAIQEYQNIKARHRQAELDIEKAKAQAEVYKKEIANILTSEGVSSIQNLKEKYEEELQKLQAVTALLTKETNAANEALAKLGVGI